tara:strand:- start:1164 stop:2333 length:1170 start_codon:yes stop_codon:yes gene_type:complete
MIDKIKILAAQYLDDVIKIRRHIHKHPELSFNEYETSNYIKSILKSWNIPFIDNIANTGIMVIIRGINPDSKTLALRADFDALPILEQNDVEYCSVNMGVMHACGHDAHTASLLGTLKILNEIKDEWEGSVKFIFQPAEEMLPGGAKQMIDEGVLKNPQVNSMLAQHVFPDLEVGKVGFCPGKYMASTDELYVKVKGKGGHAALPEKYNNPIIASARLISLLDDHFSMYKSNEVVFAIGCFESLGSTNIIPNCSYLKGTLRVLDENLRNQLHEEIITLSDKIAQDYNINIEFDIRNGYPCLINDKNLTKSLINCAKEFLGDDNVVILPVRMTAEDFAYYTQEVPSCFYRLGTLNVDKGITNGLHTPLFDIDEDALEIGMGLMAYLTVSS